MNSGKSPRLTGATSTVGGGGGGGFFSAQAAPANNTKQSKCLFGFIGSSSYTSLDHDPRFGHAEWSLCLRLQRGLASPHSPAYFRRRRTAGIPQFLLMVT